MVDNALSRNDRDTSATTIVLQNHEELSSELVGERCNSGVSVEETDVPLCGVVRVELWCNALNVFLEKGYR